MNTKSLAFYEHTLKISSGFKQTIWSVVFIQWAQLMNKSKTMKSTTGQLLMDSQ